MNIFYLIHILQAVWNIGRIIYIKLFKSSWYRRYTKAYTSNLILTSPYYVDVSKCPYYVREFHSPHVSRAQGQCWLRPQYQRRNKISKPITSFPFLSYIISTETLYCWPLQWFIFYVFWEFFYFYSFSSFGYVIFVEAE